MCYKNPNFKHSFKVLNMDAVKLSNPVSSFNNCFFKCVSEGAGLEKMNREQCNAIRAKYGVSKDCPISVEKAIHIAKEEFNIDLGIMNQSYDFFGKEGDINLMLVDDHYLLVEKKKAEKICEKCGVMWKFKHDAESCARRCISKPIKYEPCSCSEIYNCDPNYSEKGNCVLNYLEERLGRCGKNIPGKLMKREFLNGYFVELKRMLDSVNPNPTNMNDIKEEEEFVVDEIDWEAKEVDGITPYMIYLFCKQFNLSHICISAIGEIVSDLRYIAKGNHSRPALIYVSNGHHLYPIKDHHEKRKIIEKSKTKTKQIKQINFESDRDNPIILHLTDVFKNDENKNLSNPYWIKGLINKIKELRYTSVSVNIKNFIDDIEEEKETHKIEPEDIYHLCKYFDINYECISEFGNIICKIEASSEDRPKLFLIYEDEMYFFSKKEDVENYQKCKNAFLFSSLRVLPKIWREGQKEPENMLIKTEKTPTCFRSIDSNIKAKIRTSLNADKQRSMKTGNITLEDVQEMLKNQNNKCWLCQDEVILNNWLRNCCYQFSIDRIDDNLPHDKNNCRISCYFCNCRDGNSSLSPYKVCNAGCHRQMRFIKHRRDVLPEKYIRKINRDNKL